MICKNCGYECELKYCPQCGQRTSVRRIDFKAVFTESIPALFDLERGFFFNLAELYRRPGYAILDYLDGKRKNFLHPLSYLLIIVATLWVAMAFLNVHYYDAVQDAGMSAEDAAFWKEYDQAQQTWLTYYKYFIPYSLPWMTLVVLLLLRAIGQRRNYWECIVVTLFISAQMTAPQIIVLLLVYASNSAAVARLGELINMAVLMTIYFFQFYQMAAAHLPRFWRVAGGLAAAIILAGFSYVAVYSFQWLMTLVE